MKVDAVNLMIDGPVGQLDTIFMQSPHQPIKGIALVAHPNPTQGGTNTNKVVQTLAKAFARKGYVVYCPNLRGVGNSQGEFDAGIGETDDMAAVLAYARRQHGELPLILSGFSFGTFVQSNLAARLTAAGETFGLLLAGPAVKRFALPPVPADTLILHGEEDEVIPLQDVLDWARPQKLPVVVFPGVSHFFHGHLGQLTEWVNLKWPS